MASKNNGLRLIAIRLSNLASFHGVHVVPIHNDFTVVIGRNNSGKSTLLSVPGLVTHLWRSQLRIGNSITAADTAMNHLLHRGSPGFERDSCSFSVAFTGSAWSTLAFLGLSRHPALIQKVPIILRQGHKTTLKELERFENLLKSTGPVSFEIGVNLSRAKLGDGHPSNELFVRVFEGAYPEDQHGPSFSFIHAPDGTCWTETHLDKGVAPRLKLAADTPYQSLFQRLPEQLASHFASWSGVANDWMHGWGQDDRRVQSLDGSVDSALHYLKTEQDNERGWHPVSRELERAFPELRRIYSRSGGSGNRITTFELARLKDPTNEQMRLVRSQLGAGVWSYLAQLTAINIASLTDAQSMLLDEPQLHLHPELERKLVAAISKGDGGIAPDMQFLVATHSPAFVDWAWRNGFVHVVRWDEERQSSVIETDVRRPRDTSGSPPSSLVGVWGAVSTSPSELLFCDRVCFVEGGSDAVALRTLIDGLRWNVGLVSFVELNEPDAFVGKSGHALLHRLPQLALAHRGMLRQASLLVLDRDKEESAKKYWSSMPGDRFGEKGVHVFFAGNEDGELEDAFVAPEFLKAFVTSVRNSELASGPDSDWSLSDVDGVFLEGVQTKGTSVLDVVFQRTLGTPYSNNKPRWFRKLAAFLVENQKNAFAEPVLTALVPLREFFEDPSKRPWLPFAS